MTIYLPHNIQIKLLSILKNAGNKEIGGILMGEHIAENQFRIVNLYLQKQQGSTAFFVRHTVNIATTLYHFFKKTKNNFTKFNYLGEWHSHPLFTPFPSQKDIASMLEIVTDKQMKPNFAILLIVRLQNTSKLEATATVFLPNHLYFPCELILEDLV